MNPSELFERWAPDQGAWSSWVKPVLFACGTADAAADEEWRAARDRVRGRFVPPRAGDTALVFDLAGPEGLATALECAAHGYRPVPLFNSSLGIGALVANGPMRAGLEQGLEELAAARLAADATPAFVLDARRMKGDAKPKAFDNR
ncbi:MAG TPA: hypothetical protein VK843_08145, partial [Planctomycetota bacterium]|nr:hypothetical protein [Planctomycetota bacterium]